MEPTWIIANRRMLGIRVKSIEVIPWFPEKIIPTQVFQLK